VRRGVYDDHRIAALVGRDDGLGVARRRERRLQVAVVEGELVGVVLRAAGLGVDDANRLSPAMPAASRMAVNVLPDPVPPARPMIRPTCSRTAGRKVKPMNYSGRLS
jgi:hypothetical protein